MKLLIPIDQKGTIAAGLEAPNSWEPFHLPVKAIPAAIRPFIADRYNPATSKLAEPVTRMRHPLNEEKVIAWLQDYHRSHMKLAEEKQRKEDDIAAKNREAALE